MIAFLGNFIIFLLRFKNYCIRKYQISKLGDYGKNVYIGADCILTMSNIFIGNDVYIGQRCIFQSSYGKIYIGDHCMFGPGVNIHGGNHKYNEIGILMKKASPKKMGDDGIIRIEPDCWIGANAIILSNVTIGRGSVIGAGAIVTHDIKPYSIYVGSSVPKIRRRFSEDEMIQHENILYGSKTDKLEET